MRDNASNKYKIASVVKKLENEKIIIECCFLDGNKESFRGDADPFLRVSADEIDKELKEAFGDKDIIVIGREDSETSKFDTITQDSLSMR